VNVRGFIYFFRLDRTKYTYFCCWLLSCYNCHIKLFIVCYFFLCNLKYDFVVFSGDFYFFVLLSSFYRIAQLYTNKRRRKIGDFLGQNFSCYISFLNFYKLFKFKWGISRKIRDDEWVIGFVFCMREIWIRMCTNFS